MTLPAPVPGAIVHFSFLWADEAAQGLVEGRKDRPCVILAVLGQDQVARRVVLAPITHRAPRDPEAAIALPTSLKPVLGLDDAPAWIIAAEINVSDWPGFDLRTVPGKPGAYYHGRLPPGLYAALRNLAQRLDDAGKLRRISR